MTTPAFQAMLDRWLAVYRARVPQLATIERALIADGVLAHARGLVNDHVAFRTFGTPQLGIASLEPLFLHHGYARRDAYHFAAKHLDARWYAPPDDALPRIFVSELRIDDLPSSAAEALRRFTRAVTVAPLASIDLDDPEAVVAALATAPWPAPRAADYRALLAQSEYAAWTLVNGYALNHLTVALHDLPAGLDSVVAFNAYAERCGIVLNAAGGTVKTSPDGLLIQSSTLAEPIDWTFADGSTERVAGSYVEFAERRVLPAFAGLPEGERRREHRRDGFEAANADRIFESTDLAQRTR